MYGYIDEDDYQVIVSQQATFEQLYAAACEKLGKTYVELQEIRIKLPGVAKEMGILLEGS